MQNYQLRKIIGEGTYGHVYSASRRGTNEQVAIKRFKENVASSAMNREIRTLQRLSGHSNIVKLLDVIQRSGDMYLVFQLYDSNLLQILQAREHRAVPDKAGLPDKVIQTLSYQMFKALAFCHQHSCVHRDLKLENLLVNYRKGARENQQWHLALCDFGFARTLNVAVPKKPSQKEEKQAETGDAADGTQRRGFKRDRGNCVDPGEDLTDYVSTRWYRSPDCLIGSRRYDYSIDVWAAGVILGEMCDGNPMFAGENDMDQLHLISNALGPLPRSLTQQFFLNPRFRNVRLPNQSSSPAHELPQRYGSIMSPACLDLVQKVVVIDAEKRPTAAECEKHFFHDSCRRLRSADAPVSASRREARSARGVRLKPSQEQHRAPAAPEPPVWRAEVLLSGPGLSLNGRGHLVSPRETVKRAKKPRNLNAPKLPPLPTASKAIYTPYEVYGWARSPEDRRN